MQITGYMSFTLYWPNLTGQVFQQFTQQSDRSTGIQILSKMSSQHSEKHRNQLQNFFNNYFILSYNHKNGKNYKYSNMVESIALGKTATILVELQDLKEHDEANEILITNILSNKRWYTNMVKEIILQMMDAYHVDLFSPGAPPKFEIVWVPNKKSSENIRNYDENTKSIIRLKVDRKHREKLNKGKVRERFLCEDEAQKNAKRKEDLCKKIRIIKNSKDKRRLRSIRNANRKCKKKGNKLSPDEKEEILDKVRQKYRVKHATLMKNRSEKML